MLYVQWVAKVLGAMAKDENHRTRLVGIPPAALREPLYINLSDVDAIEDALYDLELPGLVWRRPAGTFNLTAPGRQAAAGSIEGVLGPAILETCRALTDDQRNFLHALLGLSETDYTGFARARYVNVELVFDKIGLQGGSHEEEEAFLLPLVESRCIDYREYAKDRDARPLVTGILCAAAARR